MVSDLDAILLEHVAVVVGHDAILPDDGIVAPGPQGQLFGAAGGPIRGTLGGVGAIINALNGLLHMPARFSEE